MVRVRVRVMVGVTKELADMVESEEKVRVGVTKELACGRGWG